jgi:hypothetical protein
MPNSHAFMTRFEIDPQPSRGAQSPVRSKVKLRHDASISEATGSAMTYRRSDAKDHARAHMKGI